MQRCLCALLCAVYLAGCGTTPSGGPATGGAEALQKQRLEYIEQLVEDGVIVKTGTVSPAVSELYVDGPWYFVPRPRQETYANVVFTYWKNEFPEMEYLVLKDGFDGSGIGRFDLDFGLQLDR